MSKIDSTYAHGLRQIVEKGYIYEDPNRKGVYRKEIPSFKLRHELSYGFPIISLKKSYFKGAIAELLFFLSGSTDIRDLWKRGVRFWDDDWARFHNYNAEEVEELKRNAKRPDGKWSTNMLDAYNMGHIYPKQYRNFDGTDQIVDKLTTLRDNPMSTGMVVNAWNPAELSIMCLPPCHYGFQILSRPLTLDERIKECNLDKVAFLYDINEREASDILDKYEVTKYGFEIHWQQRSTDYFLGTPVNVQFYAAMAILFEVFTGHKALAVEGDLKNVHLYDNQFEQAVEMLARDVWQYRDTNLITSDFLNRIKQERYFDRLEFDEILNDIEVKDFTLENYQSYPKLTAKMLTYDK